MITRLLAGSVKTLLSTPRSSSFRQVTAGSSPAAWFSSSNDSDDNNNNDHNNSDSTNPSNISNQSMTKSPQAKKPDDSKSSSKSTSTSSSSKKAKNTVTGKRRSKKSSSTATSSPSSGRRLKAREGSRNELGSKDENENEKEWWMRSKHRRVTTWDPRSPDGSPSALLSSLNAMTGLEEEEEDLKHFNGVRSEHAPASVFHAIATTKLMRDDDDDDDDDLSTKAATVLRHITLQRRERVASGEGQEGDSGFSIDELHGVADPGDIAAAIAARKRSETKDDRDSKDVMSGKPLTMAVRGDGLRGSRAGVDDDDDDDDEPNHQGWGGVRQPKQWLHAARASRLRAALLEEEAAKDAALNKALPGSSSELLPDDAATNEEAKNDRLAKTRSQGSEEFEKESMADSAEGAQKDSPRVEVTKKNGIVVVKVSSPKMKKSVDGLQATSTSVARALLGDMESGYGSIVDMDTLDIDDDDDEEEEELNGGGRKKALVKFAQGLAKIIEGNRKGNKKLGGGQVVDGLDLEALKEEIEDELKEMEATGQGAEGGQDDDDDMDDGDDDDDDDDDDGLDDDHDDEDDDDDDDDDLRGRLNAASLEAALEDPIRGQEDEDDRLAKDLDSLRDLVSSLKEASEDSMEGGLRGSRSGLSRESRSWNGVIDSGERYAPSRRGRANRKARALAGDVDGIEQLFTLRVVDADSRGEDGPGWKHLRSSSDGGLSTERSLQAVLDQLEAEGRQAQNSGGSEIDVLDDGSVALTSTEDERGESGAGAVIVEFKNSTEEEEEEEPNKKVK